MITLGRGWGTIRLIFLSLQKILRARAGELLPRGLPEWPLLQELREQGDLDRIPVAAPSKLCSQGKRGWETHTLLCPSHKPGRADLVLQGQHFVISCLPGVYARQHSPQAFALKKFGVQDKTERQVGFYFVFLSCGVVHGHSVTVCWWCRDTDCEQEFSKAS